ncbi:MAG: small-conductance mechanosensitive channel [Candidatus Azotimanducaceae bacterium]
MLKKGGFNMPQFQQVLDKHLFTIAGYDLTFGQLILFPLILVVGYLAIGWSVRKVTKVMIEKEVNPDLVQVVRRAVYVVGLIILIITVLDLLNVPLTAFAFVSGAVAIGVGFGAQNIINNFISGWILIWERPIRINDYIEVGDTSGTVEEINTRSTKVRRVDGVHLLIPNSKLLEETVVNWTLVDSLLRCIVRVGVQYGADVEKARKILESVAVLHPLVIETPKPEVIFEDFGDSALIFDVYFWVNSVGEKNGRQIRSDIRFSINSMLEEAGIVIAFPQHDVHMDGTLRIRQD